MAKQATSGATSEAWLAHPWPKEEQFAVPEAPGSRRDWAKESWEDRYRRQHLEMLEVAARLADELGYERTQISDIVKEARVSKRAFYEHWPSKDACFADLIRLSRRLIIHSMKERAERQWPNALGTFSGMLDSWIAQLRSAPHLYVVMRGTSEPALNNAQQEGIVQFAAIFAVAARRLGTTTNDLQRVSRFFAWGAFGLLRPELIEDKSVKKDVAVLARTMCSGYGLNV
jgi:AcrR family transcriptional regulator